MNNVSDISKESVYQRALRDNGLTGMMLVVTLMVFANGLIMGFGISQVMGNTRAYERMQTAWETSSTWHSMVSAKLNEKGLDLPDLEPEEGTEK